MVTVCVFYILCPAATRSMGQPGPLFQLPGFRDYGSID